MVSLDIGVPATEGPADARVSKGGFVRARARATRGKLAVDHDGWNRAHAIAVRARGDRGSR